MATKLDRKRNKEKFYNVAYAWGYAKCTDIRDRLNIREDILLQDLAKIRNRKICIENCPIAL